MKCTTVVKQDGILVVARCLSDLMGRARCYLRLVSHDMVGFEVTFAVDDCWPDCEGLALRVVGERWIPAGNSVQLNRCAPIAPGILTVQVVESAHISVFPGPDQCGNRFVASSVA